MKCIICGKEITTKNVELFRQVYGNQPEDFIENLLKERHAECCVEPYDPIMYQWDLSETDTENN